MKVLVTGGAGYIGSHAVKRLRQSGHNAVVLDNLIRGHREAVPPEVPFYQLDLRETAAVTTLLVAEGVDCVMHFAALSEVGEAVEQPLRYYDNNTWGTISLLQAMQQANVFRLVFSSTCATYGQPEQLPISESEKQLPINPYGWSKLFVERILADYARAQPNFAYCALRYFNVAGNAEDGSIGEDHNPETHLIPIVLQAALGLREKVHIFGDDYDTVDGTCVRDYVHVDDLVYAHIAVMEQLKPGDTRFYNLGIGRGYSVKQVIDTVRIVTGREFLVEVGPRRSGDAAMLFASAKKAELELGWSAKYTDLSEIVETAWRWFRSHPKGYLSR
jgi:UDP-glucose 4-epimerase